MKNPLAKQPPELSLEVQIEQLQAKLNTLIDAKAEEEGKRYGLPMPMTRRDIEIKAWGCPCNQYKKMMEQK